MPTATITAKLNPEELMRAVTLLTPRELSEFMLHFDEWQLARTVSADAPAAQIADAYRLATPDRARGRTAGQESRGGTFRTRGSRA
jgi:hypothetical protein